MASLRVLLLAASAVASTAAAPAALLREKPRHYKTNSKRVEGKINVHIIPHTHDECVCVAALSFPPSRPPL